MRTLLAFFLIFQLSMVEAQAKRIALIIGNDNYQNLPSHYQLRKARNDAKATAETFKNLGFEVIKGFDLKRRDINIKLSNFANRIEPGDEVMFFFAGHGVRMGGLNYLLPSDIPSIDSADETLLRAESLRVDEVTDLIRNRGARLSILVLDACRNNPYKDNKSRSIGGTRGLARMDPPEGTLVLFSAGAGQEALDRLDDNDPHPNSIFTRTFLPLVKQQGLELSNLSRRVKAKVRDLARTVNHTQTPAIYNEVIGDVYLSGKQNSPGTQNTTIQTLIPQTGDVILWQNIQYSTNKSDYEFFLKEHPKSTYASLARFKLQQLKSAKVAALSPLNLSKSQKLKTRGWIGINFQKSTTADKGLLITSVHRNSPSEQAGLKNQDIITSINGNLVTDVQSFADLVSKGGPNKRLKLAILRGGTERNINLTTGSFYHYYQNLHAAADRGNGQAAYSLAQSYRWGINLDKNETKALTYYRNASNAGYPPAMYSLATLTYWGHLGTKADKRGSTELYEKAALKGHTPSMVQTGIAYRYGSYKTKDYAKALSWFQQAAEKGDSSGMTNLADMYRYGLGVGKDYGQAVSWYQKSTDKNNTTGMKALAKMYKSGQGVAKDISQTILWYEKAAKQKDPAAMNELGVLYHNGDGVKKDYKKAMEWYKQAAEKNYAWSLQNIGILYKHGQGVKKDYRAAKEWFIKAANQNHTKSMYEIGFLYDRGQGVPKNYNKAFEWYQKAANKNYTDAKYAIGVLYNNGQGVGKDDNQAAYWVFQSVKEKDAFALKQMTTNHKAWGKTFRREFQKLLKQEGIYTGSIDGKFGPGTIRAVKQLAGK